MSRCKSMDVSPRTNQRLATIEPLISAAHSPALPGAEMLFLGTPYILFRRFDQQSGAQRLVSDLGCSGRPGSKIEVEQEKYNNEKHQTRLPCKR